MVSRMNTTPCDGVVKVSRSAAASNSASATRGSIGLTTTRLLTRRALTMRPPARSILANAAATAIMSPAAQSNTVLCGIWGHSCGAPGIAAKAVSVTAGSSS